MKKYFYSCGVKAGDFFCELRCRDASYFMLKAIEVLAQQLAMLSLDSLC